jgi:hypothetical protein
MKGRKNSTTSQGQGPVLPSATSSRTGGALDLTIDALLGSADLAFSQCGCTWTVGRLQVSPGIGFDPWLVDYVLDEDNNLVAVCRSRPARGHTAPIVRVLGEATTAPMTFSDGPPPRPRVAPLLSLDVHFPGRLATVDDEVQREIRALNLPIALAARPRKRGFIETTVSRLIAGYIPREDDWHWLQPGVTARTIDDLFGLSVDLASSFAWYTLTGRELVTVHLTARRQVMWLRLSTKRQLDNELRVALHIATRESTVEAWRRGDLGSDTITIEVVDQDNLPARAWEECCQMGRQGAIACPAITVGSRRRMPSPVEVAIAKEALESFMAAISEPALREVLELRALPSGEEIRVEIGCEELTAFPKNDGGLESPWMADNDTSRVQRHGTFGPVTIEYVPAPRLARSPGGAPKW